MLASSTLIAMLATAQPDEAKRFYTETLGLTLTEDTPFALVFDAGGRMLRVAKVEALTPQPFSVVGWDVQDIAAMVRGLADKGVAFERFGFLQQDDAGVWAAPGGAQIAWFKDPDGNLLSLTQFA